MITAGAIHYLIIREGSACKRHSGLEPSLHIITEPLRFYRTDHLTWADLLSYAGPRAEPSRLLFPSYVFCIFCPLRCHLDYSDLREAMSIEKRYFTSDLSNLS